MADFVQVAQVDEITEGTMKMATVGKREVLLARVGGKFYAADNRCRHMGGVAKPITEGTGRKFRDQAAGN